MDNPNMPITVKVLEKEYIFQSQIGPYAYLYYNEETGSRSIQFDPLAPEDVDLIWNPIDG